MDNIINHYMFRAVGEHIFLLAFFKYFKAPPIDLNLFLVRQTTKKLISNTIVLLFTELIVKIDK